VDIFFWGPLVGIFLIIFNKIYVKRVVVIRDIDHELHYDKKIIIIASNLYTNHFYIQWSYQIIKIETFSRSVVLLKYWNWKFFLSNWNWEFLWYV